MMGTAGPVPMATPPPGTTPTMIVAAGFINGAVSRTITAPTDRPARGPCHRSLPRSSHGLRSILQEQGVMGFWNSNLANVVQVAPENGIAFALNEVFRDRFCTDPAHPSMLEKFLLGGTAGAVAMTAVYPMYVVQNRQAAAPTGRYNGMMDCVREVLRGGTSVARGIRHGAGTRAPPQGHHAFGGYSVLKDACKDPRARERSQQPNRCCAQRRAGGAAHACTYPLHLARTVLQQPVPEGTRVQRLCRRSLAQDADPRESLAASAGCPSGFATACRPSPSNSRSTSGHLDELDGGSRRAEVSRRLREASRRREAGTVICAPCEHERCAR